MTVSLRLPFGSGILVMRGMLFLLLAFLLVGFPRPTPASARGPAPPPDGPGAVSTPGDTLPAGPGSPIPAPEPYFNLVARYHPALYGGAGSFSLDGPRLQLTHPAQFQPLVRCARPTRFHSGILGADKGAFAGMALGFLGMETGLWEEPTAWYLMGAGAAFGAIWGGTLGSENASIRVRIEPDR